MRQYLLPKVTCKCTGEIAQGKVFCAYCGRDRKFGIKKWEYLLGGLFLIILIPVSIVGGNMTINTIKPFLESPSQSLVQILPPTAFPSPSKSVESYPTTPTTMPRPTDIISTSIPVQNACSEITITMTDTPKGDILHIERCSDGWKHDTPPIAKGVYELSPNNKFLIYCTNDGDVFAFKIGNSSFTFIENIRKKMPIFRKNDDLSLRINIILGENQYWAKITDLISGQNTTIKIPLKISK